jgi:hypothetical protein
MGTHVNIPLLIEKLWNTKKKLGECCVMIDYKSDYNFINREWLYLILKDKNILTKDELDFLQEMHDAVYFKCGGKHYYLKNGVH